MAGELLVYSAWARLRVLGLKVGKPPLISWLKSAEEDKGAPVDIIVEDGAVKADVDDDMKAQRSAPRMEFPIFILLFCTYVISIAHANTNSNRIDRDYYPATTTTEPRAVVNPPR